MAQGIFTPKQHLQGIQQKSWNTAFGSTYGAYLKGDQSGQYLTGPTTSVLNFSTGNFTLEFWIHLYAVPTGLALIFSASNAGADFQVGYSTGNNVYWHNSGIQITSASSSLALGRWVHIALVRSGSTVGLFCNGIRVGSTSNSAAINLTNFNIGSYWVSPVSYMVNGLVSNLRITNTAVYDPTQTSIGLPTSPLTKISGTQLLTLQNSTIVDNSDNALSITNNGSVTTQAVSPFGIQLQTPTVDYLVVAGGAGGGGGYQGGGGGAGGLLQGLIPVATGSTITVTVGAGGAGGPAASGTPNGVSGENSVFGNIIATGGGGGGAYGGLGVPGSGTLAASTGNDGGSGGGAGSVTQAGFKAGQGIFGQGNAGGVALVYATPYCGGGGGGAGTSGFPGGTSYGFGGAGIASAISGTVIAYAGGGGGGSYNGTIQATGGAGGGGTGQGNGTVGNAGAVNTGGGGGGFGNNGNYTGYAGGSGIVIVSYPDIYAGAASTTGSPTVSTSGSGNIQFGVNGKNTYTQENSYLSVTGVPNLTGDFTVEWWYYLIATTGTQTLFSNFTGSNAANCLAIYSGSGSGLYGEIGNGSTSVATIANGSLLTNTWYHVAISRSGSTARGYINGTLNSTATTSASIIGSPIGVGAYPGAYGGLYPLQGYVSNLRIVNGTALYTSNFTPSTTPLTAISGTVLLLSTVSGAPFIDGSSNNSSVLVTAGTQGAGSSLPAWNQASPFATGLGYKNRVYTWTQSGTVTF
jgi:hypothetical protein